MTPLAGSRAFLLRAVIVAVTAATTGVLAAASRQAPPDETEIAVRIAGTISVSGRNSDDFAMTREQLSLTSGFYQTLNFRAVRLPSGFGGAPSGMFSLLSREDLSGAVPALTGDMELNVGGELSVVTCGRTPRPRALLRQGLPPELTREAAAIMPAVDRGTFYVQGCSVNPDRLLVFYMPPPGLYTIPADGPVRCNDEYTYERELGGGSVFDAALIQDEMTSRVTQDCAAPPGGDADTMVYMGAVSWRALTGGQRLALIRTAAGTDGNPQAADEPHRSMTIDIVMELVSRQPMGGQGDALAAVITASDVNRGATVTASGATSRAPKGSRIVSHEWTFTPHACSVPAQAVQLSGVQASFTATCPMLARLKVSDDRGRTAEDVKLIHVRAPAPSPAP